jgi:hypothetical protein
MIINDLKAFIPEHVHEHLRGLWNSDMETQLLFDDGSRVRIPADGNGEPNYSEHAYTPTLDKLLTLGVSGWNWSDQKSLFVTIDIDNIIGHVAGLDGQTLDDLISCLALIAEVEIIRSKSGNGFHIRIYFHPDRLPLARTRDEHTATGQRVLAWLSGRLGLSLKDSVDAVGVMAWIWSSERGEHGFELVKQSTAFMPDRWESEFPQHVETGETIPEHQQQPTTSRHDEIVSWLVSRGMAERKGNYIVTHTHHLLQAAADKSLKIKGTFATIATGKDGASGRNCYMFPDADGSFKVYRYGKNVAEHESWWKSAGGHTTTWFNRGKETKADPATVLVSLAGSDQLFHDADGRAFVTTTLHGVSETLAITDARYRSKLRLVYTDKTGRIASKDNIATAVEQLEAIALLDRPEFPVAIRVAEHDGKLYVDLANRERQIVEVSDGWRIVDDAPVRFIRPFGMLPLPTPVTGGTLAELQQFVNVEQDDLPLLLAFVVGCFHPTGPYALLQIVGEQGSAKSSLMRLIHDYVDPQIATGSTLPRDEKNALVVAQLRWLVSYDNVDHLDRKVSSLLCMLATGASSANRKLFTDDQQSLLRAKRPIILTAIANVVEASDLLDRTLTLTLPVIAPENRKSEFAIAQELRRDGVRGRILGVVLDAVAAAHRGHAAVKRDDMPRLADLFSWATAAEPAFGLTPGSAIEAIKRQSAEESSHVADDQFGRDVIKLAEAGWKGTAAELAGAMTVHVKPREASNRLREIAPDLRRNGVVVEFRKSNGSRIIELSKVAA